jgi:hypothetical protein
VENSREALGGILSPTKLSLAQAAERLHHFLRPLKETLMKD